MKLKASHDGSSWRRRAAARWRCRSCGRCPATVRPTRSAS
jgi:hypothetical protein